MQSILNILLIFTLSAIGYQDLKERSIYVIGGVVSAVLLGYLHYHAVGFVPFVTGIAVNTVIVLCILSVLWLYAGYKLKTPLLRSLGAGDIMFFFVMGLGFPPVTFIVIFVFSVFFAGIVYLVFQYRISKYQIPLAGFQAIFLVLIFLTRWFFPATNLYLY